MEMEGASLFRFQTREFGKSADQHIRMLETSSQISDARGRRHDDYSELEVANAARDRSGCIRRLSLIVPVGDRLWEIDSLLGRLLSAPVSLELEVILLADEAELGDSPVAEQMPEDDPRIKVVYARQAKGHGTTLRSALAEVSGDVVVMLDVAAGYDPHELPRLLQPLLSGHADAVFGSRFGGVERRVGRFWPAVVSRFVSLCVSAIVGLHLNDCQTGYVAIRADVLRQLRLNAQGRDIEAELLCRLSQWGARVFEVPVSCRRDEFVTKGPGIAAGMISIARVLWARMWDHCFTDHTGMYVLRSCDKASRYNQWLLERVNGMLGRRLLEAGSGIGNLSQLLTQREKLVLVDHDPLYVELLRDRFSCRENITVHQTDLTEPGFERQWNEGPIDTILCSNVLEHLEPHKEVLAGFYRALESNGHCVIIVPAEPGLYTGLDKALGHYRRYTQEGLQELMQEAGFEIAYSNQVCKIGAVAWLLNGRVLGRTGLTPRQMIWFDRLWPLLQRVDRFFPWPGMSLIVVGRKPTQQD